MTMTQMKKKIESLEKRLTEMQASIEYQSAVDGIRRGIESMESKQGKPAADVFAQLRRKHRIPLK